MRILIVHNYYNIPGGEDTVVENESALLKKNGHEVFFYKRTNKEIDEYSIIKKVLLPFNIVFSWKTYREVLRIIDEKKIDIVHVHNTVCIISPSVYYAAFKKNIPVVQTIHNFRLICPGASMLRDGKICDECVGRSLFKAVKYRCYRQSRLYTLAIVIMENIHKYIGTYKKINYICLTEFNKKQLLRINNRKKFINPDRVFVKPNFFLSDRAIIPFNNRKNQIIYAGRLDKTKGIRYLFEAWKYVNKYELLVYGIGPEEKWCRQYIEKYQIKNIKMFGYVPNNEVLISIAESKALILPTQWYEGFPMVLVESFACGTPVLGSDIGNVNQIIKENINGFHFIHNSPEDIARAINNLYDIVDSTKKISDEFYGYNNNYKALIRIYKICLENSKRQVD